MNKTTIYLPDDLKRSLEREAKRRGIAEAALVRSALEDKLRSSAPRPTPGIIAGRESIAERVDELLAGFGE